MKKTTLLIVLIALVIPWSNAQDWKSKYNKVDDFSEGLAAVELNNKWGFVDTLGKEVVPLKYDEVGQFHNGLAMVKLESDAVIIDSTDKGNIISIPVIPMTKVGFIDKTGKEIIPLIYDIAEEFSKNGTAKVIKNDTIFYINSKGEIVKPNPTAIECVSIPAGTFTMGSPTSEVDRESDESQHQVTLSAFKMSKYEVTFEQYDAFCEATSRKKPSDEGWGRGYLPVINVSWNDAIAYCKWLSKTTGIKYRLPTEAEWEYACRAGTKSSYYTDKFRCGFNANCNGSSTLPVGSFAPNAWGLYDMHGNVLEWCSDLYGGDYPITSQTNPKGSSTDNIRVNRGGSWDIKAKFCRSACRTFDTPDSQANNLGFRIVYSE